MLNVISELHVSSVLSEAPWPTAPMAATGLSHDILIHLHPLTVQKSQRAGAAVGSSSAAAREPASQHTVVTQEASVPRHRSDGLRTPETRQAAQAYPIPQPPSTPAL